MERREGTETRVRKIGGIDVQVPVHYREGDQITAGEAAMLNQTLAENISNNLRAKIEGYIPEGSPEGTTARVATAEEAQALVDSYFDSYTPGVRSGGGGGSGARALTPVEVEVRNLATSKLKEVLKSKGLKQKDVDFTGLRDKIIENNKDALTAQAEKVVRAREKAASNDEDILASIAGGLPGVVDSDNEQVEETDAA
jgi:hypothetical protein